MSLFVTVRKSTLGSALDTAGDFMSDAICIEQAIEVARGSDYPSVSVEAVAQQRRLENLVEALGEGGSYGANRIQALLQDLVAEAVRPAGSEEFTHFVMADRADDWRKYAEAAS
jgi:hypothetical protein